MGAVKALAAVSEGAELVRRCRAGDGAAWEEIVQSYSRRIYNLAYRFTSRADTAEDLTQEVFVRVYRSLDQYDPKQGDLQNWLMRLARNLIIDDYRKRQRTPHDNHADDLADQLARFEDARAAAARGDHDRSVAMLERMLARYPQTPLRAELELSRAESLLRGGHSARALQAFLELVGDPAHRGRASELWLVIGDLQLVLHRCLHAEASFGRAAQLGAARRDIARLVLAEAVGTAVAGSILGLPLGIVDVIAGQSRADVVFTGAAGHAGTTPMEARRDAVACAAEWITQVETTAREVLPLTHIRGRSLHDSFVIVDEAQSLERGVLLTVLSRLGQGSRVVLTHDVAQRDNLRVGRHDGVAAVIEKLKGHPLFAHITLLRSERSPIAALVTEMLDDLHL